MRVCVYTCMYTYMHIHFQMLNLFCGISNLCFQVELLSKKYEEKYKQSGDVASKLTIEEATFRDIQV